MGVSAPSLHIESTDSMIIYLPVPVLQDLSMGMTVLGTIGSLNPSEILVT